MTRLIHLTDLHFGLHRQSLVQPLHTAIVSNAPDLVVVSGDLTHRAHAGQFRQAMAFLRDLSVRVMVVPGNHDMPLFNLFARLLHPFGPYRAEVNRDLAPMLQVGRLRLFGINTADPFSRRGGVVRTDEIDRICRAMQDGPQDVTNILVCHHPMEEPPGFERGETRGARAAMDRLAASGLHMALSGHLHHWQAGLGISESTTRKIFQMQTGTALCARARERDHGFTVMDVAADRVSVTPWIIAEATQFDARPVARFTRHDRHWHRVG